MVHPNEPSKLPAGCAWPALCFAEMAHMRQAESNDCPAQMSEMNSSAVSFVMFLSFSGLHFAAEPTAMKFGSAETSVHADESLTVQLDLTAWALLSCTGGGSGATCPTLAA